MSHDLAYVVKKCLCTYGLKTDYFSWPTAYFKNTIKIYFKWNFMTNKPVFLCVGTGYRYYWQPQFSVRTSSYCKFNSLWFAFGKPIITDRIMLLSAAKFTRTWLVMCWYHVEPKEHPKRSFLIPNMIWIWTKMHPAAILFYE